MNRVFLDGKRIRNYRDLEQYDITMLGDDNCLELSSFEGVGRIHIYMTGTNNVFKFGKGNVVNNDMNINYWDGPNKKPCGSQIIIGDGNYFNGSNNGFIAPLTTKIRIGEGNLFAGSIKIWGRNDHIIYDIKNKARLNNDEDIDLGSNNWICENVTILPGAKIGKNSVVALGSILNKKIKQDNVLVAGVPAQIKKESINWSRACNYDDIDFDNNLNIKGKEENGF